jgi:hypothetical protein
VAISVLQNGGGGGTVLARAGDARGRRDGPLHQPSQALQLQFCRTGRQLSGAGHVQSPGCRSAGGPATVVGVAGVTSTLGAVALPPLWEIRLAAYRYAARITDAPWEPRTVISGVGPIEDWLKDGDSRELFELKCAILEEITTDYGLAPLLRNPAHPKREGGPVVSGAEGGPTVPSAGRLVELAEKMLDWVRDD